MPKKGDNKQNEKENFNNHRTSNKKNRITNKDENKKRKQIVKA